MANQFKKIPVSGSTHGRGIKVTATVVGSGDTVHTAEATTTDGLGDSITLFAHNSDSVPVALSLAWGGTTDPDDIFVQSIPSKLGLTLVVADLFLRNGLVVKAFAGTANKVVLYGYSLQAV